MVRPSSLAVLGFIIGHWTAERDEQFRASYWMIPVVRSEVRWSDGSDRCVYESSSLVREVHGRLG